MKHELILSQPVLSLLKDFLCEVCAELVGSHCSVLDLTGALVTATFPATACLTPSGNVDPAADQPPFSNSPPVYPNSEQALLMLNYGY